MRVDTDGVTTEHLGRIDPTFVRVDRLAAFLARAVDVVVTEDTKSRWWLPLVYPFLVTLMALTVTSFLAVLVVPEFEKILGDFGMRLPLMTEAARSLAIKFSGTQVARPTSSRMCSCAMRQF
jgi:type II secretory pathway component PulF